MSKQDKATADTLANLAAVASLPGNAHFNEYMHGMANGLILAAATANGVEPVYLDVPASWLQDKASDPHTLMLGGAAAHGV